MQIAEYFFNRRAALALLIVAGLIMGLVRLSAAPLIDSDEATYARVFHESVERGDFLTFTKRGGPWLEKPPLYFWLMAGSAALFGETEFAMRLPAVMLAIVSRCSRT